MEKQLIDMQEEASALGAVIMDEQTYIFESESNLNKFLYLHKDQVTVTKEDNKFIVKVS